MDGEKKISAVMIVEALGKPKEHLVETLESVAKDIGEEEDIILTHKKVHEPKEIEKQPGLFSNFVELEVESTKPMALAALMFKYMPSHTEIIEPEKMTFSNHEYSDMLSEISRRLHKVDEVVRMMDLDRRMLQKQIEKLQSEKDSNSK